MALPRCGVGELELNSGIWAGWQGQGGNASDNNELGEGVGSELVEVAFSDYWAYAQCAGESGSLGIQYQLSKSGTV